MTTYFPYSHIIKAMFKATVVKHEYFNAWSVSGHTVKLVPATQNVPITEIYY